MEPVDERSQPPEVIACSGEVDLADSGWADQIEAALASGSRHLVIDFRNVTFIDSSVVRVLVLAHRRTEADGWVRVVYTHHVVGRVLEICGLTDVFPQYPTVDAARRDQPVRSARLAEADAGRGTDEH